MISLQQTTYSFNESETGEICVQLIGPTGGLADDESFGVNFTVTSFPASKVTCMVM